MLLFNRNGYVLDFSTPQFDIFTLNSVGIALCEEYKLSKGKSLSSYINQASPESVITLLKDLFEYYEENYEGEFTPHEDSYWGEYKQSYNAEYARLYNKCKEIAIRVFGSSIPLIKEAEKLKESFSSDYLNAQIDLILEVNSLEYDKNWDVGKLTGETMKLLKLMPSDIPENAPAAAEMKSLLGNLRAIATNMAALRNPYGSGHGKSATYKGLTERHAKLAVGSSITLTSFLWETHEERRQKNEV